MEADEEARLACGEEEGMALAEDANAPAAALPPQSIEVCDSADDNTSVITDLRTVQYDCYENGNPSSTAPQRNASALNSNAVDNGAHINSLQACSPVLNSSPKRAAINSDGNERKPSSCNEFVSLDERKQEQGATAPTTTKDANIDDNSPISAPGALPVRYHEYLDAGGDDGNRNDNVDPAARKIAVGIPQSSNGKAVDPAVAKVAVGIPNNDTSGTTATNEAKDLEKDIIANTMQRKLAPEAPGEGACSPQANEDAGSTSVASWFASTRTKSGVDAQGDTNTTASSNSCSDPLENAKRRPLEDGSGSSVAPGAVHICTAGSVSDRRDPDDEDPRPLSSHDASSLDGTGTTSERLFTATLVNESFIKRNTSRDPILMDDLVEAVPAYEGFRAIVANHRFKYVVGCFLLVLLAVVLAVSLVLKNDHVPAMTIQECGSARLQQRDYRGTSATTVSGLTCQNWTSQTPHKIGERAHYSPEELLLKGMEANYCRNPDESVTGTWCYTMDPAVVAERCAVPFCEGEDAELLPEIAHNESCGTMDVWQKDYRGTVSVTASGKECQRWDSQSPHQHSRTPVNYPWSGLDANYCRNPDGEPGGAWCYTNTSESRWEYCEVLHCGIDASQRPPKFIPRRRCGEAAKNQSDYRGDATVTASGKTCAKWDTSAIASQRGHTAAEYPWSGLVGNFCRNPDGLRESAWCYLDDGTWEDCGVPYCDIECGPFNERSEDYRGNTALTVNNKRCLPWLDHTDLVFSDSMIEESSLEKWALDVNFCRNPEAEKESAWCFVEGDSGEVEWEYCAICSAKGQVCGTAAIAQADYRGEINMTQGNLTCQDWSSQHPHDHKLNPDERPWDGLSGNFCRNPDNSQRAWCYTTSPDILWDYCAVPDCNETHVA